MKLILFKLIAKLNKLLLPSLSKRRVDLTKITIIEKAVLGWKLYITKKVINQ
ncbi:MAG: SsrA-binding protein [Flavobacteriaceae bacterium]|nr:SsrA-binding protein [Flavobacteriaceae bacterium]MDG1681567.1 SsrA-binding protein [Flavobacteriaceae bacterium]RZO99793.1 MAG: SsrA-binding protein [Flavobacteriales bacterium]